MGFVDDDEIEVPNAETSHSILNLINLTHHRRIGRDIDAAVSEFLGNEVHGIGIGQVPFESIRCLSDECDAVSEEQDSFDPIASLQQLAQCDHCPGFARAGRHDNQ